jgi:hypothetical protein
MHLMQPGNHGLKRELKVPDLAPYISPWLARFSLLGGTIPFNRR